LPVLDGKDAIACRETRRQPYRMVEKAASGTTVPDHEILIEVKVIEALEVNRAFYPDGKTGYL
jgi:hypothetical protein